MTLRGVKGTQDILPPEVDVWRFLEITAAEHFEAYGFREIRTPVMEYTPVFTRSIGETTDIVEKEMYTFLDKGQRSVTLRPEGTAAVVRSYVQNALHARSSVYKLYYMGPMFRYERPQSGRYRQFHQIGAEVFGTADPKVDAEILHMLTQLLSRLGLSELDCQVNSIGCPECRPAYREAVRNFFRARLPELCTECQRRFDTNPLRIMDCKTPKCRELRSGAPAVLDHLDPACRTHFEKFTRFLEILNVPFSLNTNLVRGLDYYTRTTFEVIAEGLGAQNAVVAGGRYDGLVQEFGGPATPAMGFAMGVERTVALIRERFSYEKRPRIFMAALGQTAEEKALELASELRRRGVATELAYDGGALKSQMKRADRANAEYVLIIGDEELSRGVAQLRNMTTKEQTELTLDRIIEHVTSLP